MHVWDVTLAVGTTQQPVQRPVCIITACPAARDRQTRLRALSCKTQTSYPNAGRPRPCPAQCRDSETAKQTKSGKRKRKILSLKRPGVDAQSKAAPLSIFYADSAKSVTCSPRILLSFLSFHCNPLTDSVVRTCVRSNGGRLRFCVDAVDLFQQIQCTCVNISQKVHTSTTSQ